MARGERGGVKKWKFGVKSFMDGPFVVSPQFRIPIKTNFIIGHGLSKMVTDNYLYLVLVT